MSEINELDKVLFDILRDTTGWKLRIGRDTEIPETKRMKRVTSLNTKIMCVKHKLRERGYTIQE